MAQIVIANRLTDGIVVFLGEGGKWVEDVAQSRLAESETDAAALLETATAAEASQQVVDPILIDAERRDGRIVPTKRREAIRAMGPTIRPDLGKQAGN